MLRITQSFLVNGLVMHLRNEGWDVLFVDFVNSRRGGTGSQGALNFCFETIFDQFPDIVAVKNGTILIVEVNLAYKGAYIEKLKIFQSKKEKLFECIKNKLGLDLQSLELGLCFIRSPLVKLRGFHVWLYNRGRKKFEELK